MERYKEIYLARKINIPFRATFRAIMEGSPAYIDAYNGDLALAIRIHQSGSLNRQYRSPFPYAPGLRVSDFVKLRPNMPFIRRSCPRVCRPFRVTMLPGITERSQTRAAIFRRLKSALAPDRMIRLLYIGNRDSSRHAVRTVSYSTVFLCAALKF